MHYSEESAHIRRRMIVMACALIALAIAVGGWTMSHLSRKATTSGNVTAFEHGGNLSKSWPSARSGSSIRETTHERFLTHRGGHNSKLQVRQEGEASTNSNLRLS